MTAPKKLIVPFVLLALFFGSPPAYAEGDQYLAALADEELLLFYDVEELIVSASFEPQSVKSAPAIATVYSADELRRRGFRDLMDVLRATTGFGVTKNRFGLEVVEVRGLRGERNEKIKLLIDGHSVNDNMSGGFVWGYDGMSIDHIKRIEIIRGPGSALYGSNAFLAVINVITKKGKDLNGTIASASGGSFGTGKAFVNSGGVTEGGVEYSFFVDHLKTDGAKLFVPADSVGRSGETDDNETKTEAGFSLDFGDWHLNSGFVQRERGAFSGVTAAMSDDNVVKISQYFGELGYQKEYALGINVDAKVYVDQFDMDLSWLIFPPGVIPGFDEDGLRGRPLLKERRIGAETRASFDMGAGNRLTAGLLAENREQYDVRAFGNFDPRTGASLGGIKETTALGNWNRNASRDISAIYLQDVIAINETLALTLGVRHDHYSDTGGTTNPRAALVYTLGGWNAKVMYATAFRAPDFIAFYNQNNNAELGNPDLKPEKMGTFELGVGYTTQKGSHLRANYFRSDFSDKILSMPVPGTPGLSQFANTGGATIDGIELEGRWAVSQLFGLYGNATWQRPNDLDSGDRLAGVADFRANIGFDADVARNVSLNVHLFVSGESHRAIGDDRAPSSGYSRVDATLIATELLPRLEVRGSVYNVLDRTYVDPASIGTLAGDFPTPGRSFLIEFRYLPESMN